MLNQTPARRRRFTAGQCIAAGIAAEILAAPAALFLAFLGVIEYSGCFIECETASANRSGAYLAFAAASVIAPGGLWLAGFMSRSRTVLAWAAGITCLLPIAAVVAFLD